MTAITQRGAIEVKIPLFAKETQILYISTVDAICVINFTFPQTATIYNEHSFA